ncbi:unnamed protein product [Microthlaspi erraticum]|uniref:Uncharacterized protein n=1 Tax=Microthlaspi erraticum TaxID=1685480 RepID=A0A6D2KUZ4_9BRAS|nr:unnamed protein product [Microthlaspi erraticum]
MDFIKTSSLRALIELTFQRNWNGLIWMSRKGVTTKRVKTVQTALSRTAPKPRSPAGRGTNVPLGQISVRLKSRPKSKTVGRSRITTRETARGRPRHNRSRQCRASRETSLAAAQPVSRTTADACPASGREFIGQSSSVRPRGRPRIRPATTVPTLGHDPMSGRSSRPTVPTPRSTRSPFQAHIFQARLNPKPPLKT